MQPSLKHLAYLGFALAICINTTVQAQNKPIPHLERRGEVTQLIVDGKPYLILGGELHNSSTSSLEYLRPILPKLVNMNLNTALAAVTWDLMEPEEGKFDFTLVDGLLKQARENKLHVVLLWFGSWKNGLSHYAPDWVKADYKRFPRVKLESGKPIETITPLSQEALKCDSRAYAALMHHIKEVDSQDRTVIMIQMENEVGVIGAPRDESALASAAFAGQVPAALMAGLQKNKSELQPPLLKLWGDAGFKTSGTWQEVFGKGPAADEAFMAWNYASYMNAVTAAGKAEYVLPTYVNAWIVQPEDRIPGDYPSGGPQSHVHDIWRVAAPNIDVFAPDIYLKDFKNITAMYHHTWNPLFVPESFADSSGAANAYYAIGHFNAIGYSPFGIDNRVADAVKGAIPQAYKLLSQLSPLILDAQAKGTMVGISLTADKPSQTINLGGYTLEVNLRRTRGKPSNLSLGYGIIINTAPDEFILSGYGLEVTFKPNTPGPQTAGLASVFEGEFENGVWKPGRKLNGDNIMLNYKLAEEAAVNQTGSVARFEGNSPGILKVKVYKFD